VTGLGGGLVVSSPEGPVQGVECGVGGFEDLAQEVPDFVAGQWGEFAGGCGWWFVGGEDG